MGPPPTCWTGPPWDPTGISRSKNPVFYYKLYKTNTTAQKSLPDIGTKTQIIGAELQDVDEGAPIAMTLLGKCDGLQEASTRHYPRARRSKQCVTGIDIPAMAQSSVARSVTANSALSGTIAGEPRSAQGSARTSSRRVARPTEVGYVSCTPPAESRSGAHQRAISRSSDSWVKETAQ